MSTSSLSSTSSSLKLFWLDADAWCASACHTTQQIVLLGPYRHLDQLISPLKHTPYTAFDVPTAPQVSPRPCLILHEPFKPLCGCTHIRTATRAITNSPDTTCGRTATSPPASCSEVCYRYAGAVPPRLRHSQLEDASNTTAIDTAPSCERERTQWRHYALGSNVPR